jgi:hypothetical protein
MRKHGLTDGMRELQGAQKKLEHKARVAMRKKRPLVKQGAVVDERQRA